MNSVVLAVFLAVLLAAAAAQVKVGVQAPRAAGNVKCPGMCHIPALFLLQGTSLSAVNMAFFPGKAPAGVAVVGWMGLAACCALPATVHRRVIRPPTCGIPAKYA
eukprot:gene24825-30496_t